MIRTLSTSALGRSLCCAVLFLWLIIPASLLAADFDEEERWYQIEIIIFENNDALNNSQELTEVWTKDPGQIDLQDAVELQQPTAVNPENPTMLPSTTEAEGTPLDPVQFQAFELLPDKLLTLKYSVKQLNKSMDYQPLLHIGWRQPVPERGKATPILIDSRQLLLYQARIDEMEQLTDLDAPAPSLLSSLEQDLDEIVTDINENFVNGILTLTRGRYLHLSLDLIYQRQAYTPQLFSFFGFGNVDTPPDRFRLTQRRRLKRNEVHYFDHPRFGILAMVTAVKQEKTDQARTIPLNKQR